MHNKYCGQNSVCYFFYYATQHSEERQRWCLLFTTPLAIYIEGRTVSYTSTLAFVAFSALQMGLSKYDKASRYGELLAMRIGKVHSRT
jgi:hypothetical protein